jgi:hypothetical protein
MTASTAPKQCGVRPCKTPSTGCKNWPSTGEKDRPKTDILGRSTKCRSRNSESCVTKTTRFLLRQRRKAQHHNGLREARDVTKSTVDGRHFGRSCNSSPSLGESSVTTRQIGCGHGEHTRTSATRGQRRPQARPAFRLRRPVPSASPRGFGSAGCYSPCPSHEKFQRRRPAAPTRAAADPPERTVRPRVGGFLPNRNC